ncbi:MAG TPA: peptidyl-prolyl cis-trans isomerase [Acetobacteraceae bacterium]|nr:peptidyl-prolyl cis-trans isomerase [Acetobacteraceae bacterium]
MITTFRRYLETWPVRLFFGLMVVAFVVWGVGDVVRLIGHQTWVAKAGGETIEPQQFQPQFQRALAQMQRQLPPGQDMTQAQRQQAAQLALQQMVGNLAVAQEERRLRIVVPDAAVRQAVFAMPAFHGASGQFDRNLLDAVLRQNNMNEGEFLSIVRADIARGELIDAVTAGAAAPGALVDAIFAAEAEQRSAAIIELPFAAAPEPPAPTEAELRRFYDNHPEDYRIPEFRRIKAVILSPETIAKGIDVSDADLRAWYDSHRAQFVTPPTRSVQIAIVPDQAKAEALAAQWKSGASWDEIQKAAQADGGSAVALDKTTEAQVPDAELAKAAFAAPADQVEGPVKAALGFAVLRVSAIEPGSERSFDQVKDEVRKRLVADQAAAQLYDRANKVDDILGTGAGLDHLPNDLGLVGVSGTLDAAGNTADGKPAPIPGPEELRKAIIAAAFNRQPGPPSQLTEVQTPSTGGSAFYAVEVDEIMPASREPFDKVAEKVKADWTEAARRHAQESAAAAMLTSLKGGESMADAAAKAGLTVRTTPLITRDSTDQAVPPELRQVLFGLKPGEPTMVETKDGFLVAEADKIVVPDPKSKPERFAAVRDALTRSDASDIATIFTDALRARANPRINQPVFDSFLQQ